MSNSHIPRNHILVVTHVLPYPPSAGNEIRVLRLLRWFTSKGYLISLVVKPMGIPEVPQESIDYLSSLVQNLFIFDDRVDAGNEMDLRPPEDEAGIDSKLLELQEMFCPLWFASEIGKLIDSLRPDIVLSVYALMSRTLVSSQYTGFLKIIDSVELFSRLQENLARQGMAEHKSLDLSVDQECFLLNRADVVLAIQQTEYTALTRMLPERQVLVTAMDLDIHPAIPHEPPHGRVLIVGSDNQFNIQGTKHFLDKIWPIIKRESPSAALHVVGKLSTCLEATDSSIQLLGYVNSVADEYRNACVVVNPCRHGTGLKIKTIEALAWGKAHVGWPASADGISELGALPYTLAEDDLSFARAVCALLNDEKLRQLHEEKARFFASTHFSPTAVYGSLAALIDAHAGAGDYPENLHIHPHSQHIATPRQQQWLYLCRALDCHPLAPISAHIFIIPEETSPTPDETSCSSFVDAEMIGDSIADVNQKLRTLLMSPSAVTVFVPAGLQFSMHDIAGLAKTTTASDPLFGFAMPRIANTEHIEADLQALTFLPETERRVVEGAPVLIPVSVFRDFGLLDEQTANIDSALAQLFIRANRRGISARLVNTVIMRTNATWTGPQELRLERASDHMKALTAQAVLPEVRFDRLLQHRFAVKPIREILFDIRNLAPGFNGTAHYILSLIDHLSRLAIGKSMRALFLVLPESAKFHALHERFPDAIVHQLQPNQYFDATIRLTQPWSMTELRDQAYISTLNVFSVLDTIAWDCHYIRMPHLEGVWRTMAELSDAFVFISDFSRRRFNTRFPESQGADNLVAHCSLDPSEYWTEEDRFSVLQPIVETQEPYVLVVGNRYYHKGLAETVSALSAAFPEVRFKVLGECGATFHNVEQLASGTQTTDSIAKLFAHSMCLIFPSFYEGFGLPIFEALAFGKPVLARHSELIDELRAHIEPITDLISFSTTQELLDKLKGLLQQQHFLTAKRQPTASPHKPYRWADSANDILNLLEGLLSQNNVDRCRKRLEFFYRLEMYELERAGWVDATQNIVSFEIEKEE